MLVNEGNILNTALSDTSTSVSVPVAEGERSRSCRVQLNRSHYPLPSHGQSNSQSSNLDRKVYAVEPEVTHEPIYLLS